MYGFGARRATFLRVSNKPQRVSTIATYIIVLVARYLDRLFFVLSKKEGIAGSSHFRSFYRTFYRLNKKIVFNFRLLFLRKNYILLRSFGSFYERLPLFFVLTEKNFLAALRKKTYSFNRLARFYERL